MKTIVVEFRNAYNIGILPQLLLFDIAYNHYNASMITTILILRVIFLNNIRPEISLIMRQI